MCPQIMQYCFIFSDFFYGMAIFMIICSGLLQNVLHNNDRIKRRKIKVVIFFEPSFFLHFQALKVRTTRTTYCLHMGHSAICFPHVVQVHMCPHSSITQSTGLSMQILHKSESTIASLSEKTFQDFLRLVEWFSNSSHCSKSSFFVHKLSIFLGEKLVEMLRFCHN